MTREEAQLQLQPFIKTVNNHYQGVLHGDVRRILGEDGYAALLRDPVRNKGCGDSTVYPWNVIDYMTSMPTKEPPQPQEHKLHIMLAFNGQSWFVRRIRTVGYDTNHGQVVYHCDDSPSDQCQDLESSVRLAKAYHET